MLNIGEVLMDHVLADILAAHVDFELDPGIMDRYVFGHQVDDFARPTDFSERVHFDEVQEVTRKLRSNQAFQCQCHPFHIDVLTVVSHRSTHVHDYHGGRFRIVSRLVNFDVFGF